MESYKDRQIDNRQIDRQIDRWIDRQLIDKQIDRQIDRQIRSIDRVQKDGFIELIVGQRQIEYRK